MLLRDFSTIQAKLNASEERRGKYRFPMQRDLRYKLLKDGATVESGNGQTVDIGSGGVSFQNGTGKDLPAGNFIELSISWPVLLDDTCPMRLIVFGRVVRTDGSKCACTIDKYEFRTQSRVVHPMTSRTDTMLQRWAEGVRREAAQNPKLRMMSA
jgi:hypothetical protein